MPRVLMLSTDLERGGLPLRLARLAHRLRGTGYEPVVGCLARPGPLSQELAAEGVATFSCHASGAFDLRSLGRLASAIRRYNPDLIHASLFHANTAARVVGRLDRDRPIITSTVTIEIERPWHRFGECVMQGISNAHVANSNAVARHLIDDLNFSRNRVTVIPNAIDIEAIASVQPLLRAAMGIDEGDFLVAWAGRMDPVKNLGTFVNVIKSLSLTRKVAAVLLGDGPERAAVEKMICQNGLVRVIRMPGWVESTSAYFKAANCVLFPSWTEGSPNAVIEAMACGCPVVASDIPACRELMENGGSGLLCPPGDVSAFAAALKRFEDDPVFAADLAKRAMESVERRHGEPGVLARWVELYDQLIGRTVEDKARHAGVPSDSIRNGSGHSSPIVGR